MMDEGMKLLGLLKKQRQFYVHLVGGERLVTNDIIYNSFEDEIFKVQTDIGRENKKRIIVECKEKGWVIPQFNKEGR